MAHGSTSITQLTVYTAVFSFKTVVSIVLMGGGKLGWNEWRTTEVEDD